MNLLRGLARQLKLKYFLFLVLLGSGIIPLSFISILLISQNREILKTQEKSFLTRSAESLSVELNGYFVNVKTQLVQLGEGLLAVPEPDSLEERLRSIWVGDYLRNSMLSNPDLMALRVLNEEGVGPRLGPANLAEPVRAAMDAAFEAARGRDSPIYEFVVLPGRNEPVVLAVVPITGLSGETRIVVEALVRLHMMQEVFEREAQGEVAVFLIDRAGKMLWAEGASGVMEEALATSELVRDFARLPLNMTREYPLLIDEQPVLMQGRVSPVHETGWGVVVQKPAAAAFAAVKQMVFNTLLSTGLLVLLALFLAVLAARALSRPIQQLVDTSHEIAAGNFGRRVGVPALSFEFARLADDFNRMSDYVQQYVEELQRAAQANRDLFIGSIRSFSAAIDAKDPYTRGHSERVAGFSRTISKYLGQPDEFQHRTWVAALLHDVGKIGIDDRVLQKGGVLSDEEFELMKQHPVIGAEIMSTIEQLRPMLGAIRWHHEAWNGSGYPDGLKAEQIPLMARIVAVADCFDAITTHRPYQRGYTQEFAVETITKLAGSRFDAKVVTAFLRAFEAEQIRKAEEEETPTFGPRFAIS